jgi:hypothetical protein
MVPQVRKQFNEAFSSEKYQRFLEDLHSKHPGAIEFRIAETPVFIPKDFGDKVIECCEYIIDLILDPSFKELTSRAIPPAENVPNENDHSHFIAFDFGICQDEDGTYSPPSSASRSITRKCWSGILTSRPDIPIISTDWIRSDTSTRCAKWSLEGMPSKK